MITLQKVTKKYGEAEAISDVSINIKKGEIIGFLGPNGAGKTTTMKLIMGLIRPTVGEIKVDGVEPIRGRMSTLPKIGYLPENNPLYEDMKVFEYLEFVSKVKQANIESIHLMIEKVDIKSVLDTRIENLSRGYRQRVGLTAAMIGDPSILILDEPTSGLDPLEQEKIKNLIKELSKEKIVIFSTHVLSEVEDIASRLVIIDKGKIVFDGKKPKEKGGVAKLFKKLVS